MKHKIEIYYNNRLIVDELITSSHRNHSLGYCIRKYGNNLPDNFDAYIMNENGDVWVQNVSINHTSKKMKVNSMIKGIVPTYKINTVMKSHNKKIVEVLA